MKTNKENKKMNSELVKESLLDYNNLAKQLKESTPNMVEKLLAEQVKEAYAALLNESDDDDKEDKAYDVEEVDDTDVAEPVDDEGTAEEAEEETPEADTEEEEEADADDEDVVADDSEDETDDEETPEAEEDEISHDFDKYKTADNEYDFRNAEDEDIVKVYKLLKGDDCVKVVKDNDTIKISDDEVGTEYIIKLDDDTASDDEKNIDDNINTENMNESIIYELALNEYDSHVGYTDNYQDKDVMTNDGVAEPSKNGRDIDKGVPHDNAKPWAKPKKNPSPFTEKGKTVECGGQGDDIEAPIENEAIGAKHGALAHGTPKFHDTNSGEKGKNPNNKHTVSRAGEYVGHDTPTNEAIVKKAKKIFEDNKKLKEMLNQFETKLQEAAVVNVNLGGIIKLISENSTSKSEKKAIIDRFTNEAHTVNESQNLYRRISEELKQKPAVNADINEEVQLGNSKNSEVINESKFYQDESLMNSLGLMHKIC